MAQKVLMEEMSWVEIQEALEQGRQTVILVSGSVEQHGPHLPTGTDTILGYEVAQRAARKLGNTLVAPVLRPCLSEHHMAFPGSFTLRWETYRDLLQDCCESLSAAGFKDIVLTSSHGGNNAMLAALTPGMARSLRGKTRLHMVDYLALAQPAETSCLEELGICRGRAGVHAGYTETAMMLAVQPGAVRAGEAAEGYTEESFYDPARIARSQIDSFILGIRHFSENGILGDARGATPKDGSALLEAAVNALVEGITNCKRGTSIKL